MNLRPSAALLPLAGLPLALAGLLLAGCHNGGDQNASSGGSTPSATTGGSGGHTMLAFVTNNPSDYWTICRKGCDRRPPQKELPGVQVQFVMPDDGTAATQKRDVDDLLAKGVQGHRHQPRRSRLTKPTDLNSVGRQSRI